MAQNVISVEHLTKKFGSLTAVDDVSFHVEEGTIFGFLGPNGAGKTTTINILCTLLAPTSGHASIDGHDCMEEPSMVRRSIGIVFQDTTLDKDLTAYENLAFHAYLYGVPRREVKQRVHDALEFVQLVDRRDDLVKRFSGGMKRRLEVARGMIHRPRVLFLDEPTLGLDPQSRANLWEFITELPGRHKMTVFMTTHYMEEAEVCNRIAIIDKGKIVLEGTPDELKKSIGGDVIYLRATDNERARRTLAEASIESEARGKDLFVKSHQGDRCIPEIIRALGDSVISIRLERPTLNDVLLAHTGKAIREEDMTGMDNIKGEVRAYRRRTGGG